MIWQTIETAPKDGTWILIYGDDGARSAYWDNREDDFVQESGACGWENWAVYVRNPTHWMHLPEPPQ